jgi:hypothetical protein
MAISSLSTSSMVSGVKRRRVWDQSATTDGFFQIASTTAGAGGTSTITFSSIPTTYTHLQLRISCRSTTAAGLSWSRLRMNSDSTNANYKGHQLYGEGSSAASTNFGSESGIAAFLTVGSTGTANVFNAAIIDILDYSNTNKYKTIKVLQGNDTNGAGYIIFHSGVWMSTSSINSLTFLDVNSGNYAQGSIFSLYGMKA